MKKILTLLVLILTLSAHGQITSFIKHGDTVYCYFPTTKDSIRVNYSAGTVSQSDINSAVSGALSGKVNVSDTASMLSTYFRTINLPNAALKVNVSDTASMLSTYARTINLPNAALKVNVADTASMLATYLRINVASATYAPLISPSFTTPALGTPASGNFSTGSFTWPTFNQNTTGSAAKLTTARTINGVSFDGTANITIFPQQVATADIAATASATSTTTLFTPTADGMYRVSIYLKITTTGTSPVAGPVTITYTDADGSVAQSHVMLLQSTTGTVVTTTVNNSSTTGTVNGSMVVNAKSGVAIQYAIAVSGTFGAGRYTAHLTCERIK